MKIQVCVTNLGNYQYVYGYVNPLSDIGNLEEEVNPLGMNDTAIQLIDTDINISDRNLIPFLELLEEYKITPAELAALFQVGTASEVREILEYDYSYQFIEACNKETAFQIYYQELYNDIPEHLEDYIDWNKLMRNFECGNLTIENLGPGKHPLTDRFIFVQKY